MNSACFVKKMLTKEVGISGPMLSCVAVKVIVSLQNEIVHKNHLLGRDMFQGNYLYTEMTRISTL